LLFTKVKVSLLAFITIVSINVNINLFKINKINTVYIYV